MNIEEAVILIIGVALYLVLVLLRAIRPYPANLSRYELERRVKSGDSQAESIWKQKKELPDILVLRQIGIVIISVCTTTAFLYSLGWLFGIVVSIVAMVYLNQVYRYQTISDTARRLYAKYIQHILKLTEVLRPLLRIVRDQNIAEPVDVIIHSKEELRHIIAEARGILTQDEQYLLAHSMNFKKKLVREITTPKSVVDFVDKKELLGPVVLDRLHKTGHSRFPVMDGDTDHIVGLLYMHDLISEALNTKNALVEKVMERKVYYINEDQPLSSALAGFLRVKHHLFIVVNEFEETTGVITIEDTIETLIGHKIVDEFDQYEDLRAVAKQAVTKRHKSNTSSHIK